MERAVGLVPQGGKDSRSWPRARCGADGVLDVGEADVPVSMVDASRGGFKLRFESDPAVEAVLSPPVELSIVDSTESVYGASVMWLKGGLAGCRFHQHQSLDTIAGLMTRSFRLTAAR
jgi:hypothetical protein